MTRSPRGGRRTSTPPSFWRAALAALVPLTLLASCGDDEAGSAPTDGISDEPLVIGGIPDQDPDRLQRQFGMVADRLSELLGIHVVYEPVAEYDAAVSAFRVGDLDLVWFGGLTGVQARLQVDGSQAIAQRDIDPEFRSVFIAHTESGIDRFDDIDGLGALAGRTFTFGSPSSTSGRLMPQAFLARAGVTPDDFDGQPGFSGSHDATIELVSSGAFDAGVLNEQVWDSRRREGTVGSGVVELFRTPTYHDYHWVVRPHLERRYGPGIVARIVDVLTSLDADDPTDAEILDLFGAESFIPTENGNYATIEAVARDLGRIEG